MARCLQCYGVNTGLSTDARPWETVGLRIFPDGAGLDMHTIINDSYALEGLQLGISSCNDQDGACGFRAHAQKI